MRRDDVARYLNRQPFQPFRLYLSTGTFGEVRYPQSASLAHSTLTVGLPLEGGNQRFLEIALIHIVWIEVQVPAPWRRGSPSTRICTTIAIRILGL
jgi:hypothetical protein